MRWMVDVARRWMEADGKGLIEVVERGWREAYGYWSGQKGSSYLRES